MGPFAQRVKLITMDKIGFGSVRWLGTVLCMQIMKAKTACLKKKSKPL